MDAVFLISLVVILIAIIHEEKLIDLEDWLADRIGYIAAKVYLSVKKVRINKLVKSTDRLAKRVSK
ncbi:MAG: hypothetical protein IIW48_10075 [Clostridia bacterium]|nr:hypothetical protein [Clostridia bacterium]